MLLLIKIVYNVINARTGSITIAQKLPAYIIIQLSKSAMVFTCPSCVKSKYPLVFQKLNDDIEKIIMTPVSQPSSPKNPTTPLTPSAPPSPLFIQLTPNPLIPSPPSNFSPANLPYHP